jgi:hypothetical protein
MSKRVLVNVCLEAKYLTKSFAGRLGKSFGAGKILRVRAQTPAKANLNPSFMTFILASMSRPLWAADIHAASTPDGGI